MHQAVPYAQHWADVLRNIETSRHCPALPYMYALYEAISCSLCKHSRTLVGILAENTQIRM